MRLTSLHDLRRRAIARLTSGVLVVLLLPLVTRADLWLAPVAADVRERHEIRRHAYETLRARAPAILGEELLPALRALAEELVESSSPPAAEPARRARVLSDEILRARLALLDRMETQIRAECRAGAGLAAVPAALEAHRDAVADRLARLATLSRWLTAPTVHRRRLAAEEILRHTEPPRPVRPAETPAHAPEAPRAVRDAPPPPGQTLLRPRFPDNRLLASAADCLWPGWTELPAHGGPPTAADRSFRPPFTSDGSSVARCAAEHVTPVRIFEFFRNDCVWEPYFGLVKGAERTLLERGGNDADLAAALVSVLRVAGVPARFAYGTIRLTRAEAAQWLGVPPGAVGAALAAAGLPAAEQGDTIWIDRVWVQAYLDYIPYHGADEPAQTPEAVPAGHWIDLDPACKPHTCSAFRRVDEDLGLSSDVFHANVRVAAARLPLPALSGVANASADQPCDDAVAELPRSLILDHVTGCARALDDLMVRREIGLDALFRERRVAESRPGILACTDLYEIHARGGAWSAFPDALAGWLRLVLSDRGGHVLLEADLPMARALKSPVLLRSDPATEADRQILGSRQQAPPIDGFPLHLVRVVPTLVADGQALAVADEPCPMGTELILTGTCVPAGTDPAVFQTADAGRIRRFSTPVQAGARTLLVGSAGRLPDRLPAEAMRCERVDDLLAVAGMSWLYLADRFGKLRAGILGYDVVRAPSFVSVSAGFECEPLFGAPFLGHESDITLSVLRDAFVLLRADPDGVPLIPAQDAFARGAAAAADMLGSHVLGTVTGCPASSPGQDLVEAAQAGTVVRRIVPSGTQTLPPDPLAALGVQLPASAATCIESDLADGRTVLVPAGAIPAAAGTRVPWLSQAPDGRGCDLKVLRSGRPDPLSAGGTVHPPELPPLSSLPGANSPRITAAAAEISDAWVQRCPDAVRAVGLALLAPLTHLRDASTGTDAAAVTGPTALQWLAALTGLDGRLGRLLGRPAIANVVLAPRTTNPDEHPVSLRADVIDADSWTVSLMRPDGSPARTLTPEDNLDPHAGDTTRIRLSWDGTDEAGTPVPDGTCRVRIAAAAPTGELVASDTVTIDRTPPSVRVELVSHERQGTRYHLFRGDVEDLRLTQWHLRLVAANGETHEPASGTSPVRNGGLFSGSEADLPRGTFSVRLEATDAAGNTAAADLGRTVTFEPPADTEPPAVTATGAPFEPNPPVLKGTVPLAFSAGDPSGVARLTLMLDGAAVEEVAAAELQYALDTAALSEGEHTLTIEAVDTVGNGRTTDWAFVYSEAAGDGVPPDIAIELPDTTAPELDTADLEATAGDNLQMAHLRLRLDGSITLLVSGELPELRLDRRLAGALFREGTHRLTLEARDASGLDTIVPLAAPSTEDTAPPAIAMSLSVTDGDQDVRGPVHIDLSATDNTALRQLILYIDGVPAVVRTAPRGDAAAMVLSPADLPDGPHALRARAVDISGNIADTETTRFTTRNPIRSFAVTPGLVDADSPEGTLVHIAGTLGTPRNWRIRVAAPGTTAVPDITGTGDTIRETLDVAGLPDGLYRLTLRVAETDVTAEAELRVNLVDGPPVAEIDTFEGETDNDDAPHLVREGLLELTGTADDPDADDSVRWRIALLGGAGEHLRWLTPDTDDPDGRRTGRVREDTFGVLDLTGVRNGVYTLSLEVEAGGTTTTDHARIALESACKIGQFGFSQQDLVLPVSGLPLAVTRTYSTLRTDSGDFGVGWTFSMADVELTHPERRAIAWDETGQPFSRRIGGNRDVTITLPGGRRTTFRFRLTPPGFLNPFTYRAEWVPAPGTNATLECLGSDELIALPALDPYWQAAGMQTPFEAYEFPGYRLTLEDGTEFLLEREETGSHFELDPWTGRSNYIVTRGGGTLREIRQPNGSRIRFRPDGTGMDHLDPAGNPTRAIVFERDDRGRITALHDPAGTDEQGTPTGRPRVRYEYDAGGNLTAVHHLAGDRDSPTPTYQTTEYRYGNPRYPHYLTAIVDPRGVQPMRTRYDDHGRLIGLIDAHGEEIALSVDPAAKTRTVHDREGNPTVHVFDARGNVTRSIDALGNRTEWTYDELGNATSVTNPLGQTTRSTYDARGHRTSRTDSLGNTTTRVYDEKGRVLEEHDPAGAVTTTRYGSTGQPVAHTDALGNTTSYTYDANGNPAVITGPDGTRLATFAFSSDGRLQEMTRHGSPTVRHTHDANGNTIASTITWTNPDDPDDRRDLVSRTEVDAAGRPVAREDPRGNRETTVYNAIGKPVRVTSPLGTTLSYAYDAAGRRVAVQHADGLWTHTLHDANGRTTWTVDRHPEGDPGTATKVIYDALGRVTCREQRQGVAVDMSLDEAGVATVDVVDNGTVTSRVFTHYDAAGRKIRVVGPEGETIRYDYDAAGRRIAVVGVDGERTDTVYDSCGRETLVRNADGNETAFRYDARGRRLGTTLPDDASATVLYDAYGRPRTRTDPAGTTRQQIHDAAGRLVAVILPELPDPEDPNGTLVQPRYDYTYDAFGHHVATADPKGRETRIVYDPYGNPTARILPLGQEERTEYDDLGRVRFRIDPAGRVHETVYDALGRMERERFYDARTAGGSTDALPTHAPDEEVRYVYDTLGRLDRVTHDGAVTAYTYDAAGRVIRTDTPDGTIRCEWDPATGRRTRLRTAHSDLRCGYDAAGRLQVLTVIATAGRILPEPLVYTYHYDALGRCRGIERPDGLMTVHEHDALGRLTTLTHFDAAGDIIAAYQRTYDAAGRCTRVDETHTETDGTASRTVASYAYDPLGRLAREAVGSDLPHLARTVDFTYDLVGNRIRTATNTGDAIEETIRTYDANDRLLAEETTRAGDRRTVDYTYDPGGCLTAREAIGFDPEAVTLDYTARAQLRSVDVRRYADGRPIQHHVAYTYGHDGLRRTIDETTEYLDSGDILTESTALLYDTESPAGWSRELDRIDLQSGTVRASFVHGHQLLAQTGPAGFTHALSDPHGSVRTLVDPTATVLARQDFDAFGNLLEPASAPDEGAPRPDAHGFAGEPHDPDTALHYLRARYYAPAIAAFTQSDPFHGSLQSPLSLHRHTYCHNDPINHTDPSGMWTMKSTMVAVGLSIGLGTLSGYTAHKAKRSVLFGVTIGMAAGPALVYAFHGRRLGHVMARAMLGMSIVTAANLIYHGFAEGNRPGDEAMWEGIADAVETFCWAAVTEGFLTYDAPNLLAEAVVLDFGVNLITRFLTLSTEFIANVSGGSSRTQEHYERAARQHCQWIAESLLALAIDGALVLFLRAGASRWIAPHVRRRTYSRLALAANGALFPSTASDHLASALYGFFKTVVAKPLGSLMGR